LAAHQRVGAGAGADDIIAVAGSDVIAAVAGGGLIVALAQGDAVVAVAGAHHVIAAARVDGIVAGAGQDHVIALAAPDPVMTLAGIQAVVAPAAIDAVIALVAEDGVVAGHAPYLIGRAGAEQAGVVVIATNAGHGLSPSLALDRQDRSGLGRPFPARPGCRFGRERKSQCSGAAGAPGQALAHQQHAHGVLGRRAQQLAALVDGLAQRTGAP